MQLTLYMLKHLQECEMLRCDCDDDIEEENLKKLVAKIHVEIEPTIDRLTHILLTKINNEIEP